MAILHIPDIAHDLQVITDALARKGYGVANATVRLKKSKRGDWRFSPYYVVRLDPAAEWYTEHIATWDGGKPYKRRYREVSVYGSLTGAIKQIEKLPERNTNAA